MRKLAFRLIALLYMISIAPLQPFLAGERLDALRLSRCSQAASTSVTCCCPMCRTAGGTKSVCPCCRGNKCTCRLSSGEEAANFLLQDESVLCKPAELHVVILCTALTSEVPYFARGPYLSPATPPPRIYAT